MTDDLNDLRGKIRSIVRQSVIAGRHATSSEDAARIQDQMIAASESTILLDIAAILEKRGKE
ncbi:hypothetical protein NO263_02020 [Gluconacetobacter entanii]|uniref:Uncharacterized protein n=1 Tax=Gluconacetobacter entanii TaxID=108528 RepID=A0ABT3K1U0_9PROT|nr:hypothetical protein [Gluconacetobacter entanii]MCW4589366.1 hypothetical protein [Gluconacetobacter entanii]MCW4592997.1 hypothetical protein [Gluconacetobacter entanii]NPC90226.1 hypothetical protein [Gluconacetobacter entanii]